MTKKLVSALLVITILFCSNIGFGLINGLALDSSEYLSKVSPELKKYVSGEKLTAYVWLKDEIDMTKIKSQAERNLGFTQENLEQTEKKNCEFVGEVYTSAGFTKEYNSFLSKTKELRQELLNKQNQLIKSQRDLAKVFYSQYNKEKLQTLGIDEKNVVYFSQYSPVIIITTNKLEIEKLSKSEIVEYIGYKDPSEPVVELNSAMTAVDAAYVRNTLGYDGYGVKIGIYDTGRVDVNHSELKNTNITVLDSNNDISSHATNVSRIAAGSNGVAPNVHLYTNSSKVSAEQGLEALIDCGVSVINMSLSFVRTEGVYYTDFEKWIDHIAYQHNVTIVKSAGNSGVKTVVSNPGLAHNVITVGGTNTQYTSTKSDDTLYSVSATNGSASGNGITAGCAKPDFLAPAYMSGMGYGTSYAAPMVTGIIAQMIECRPTIASNPALIKAVLSSSTTRKMAPGFANDKIESWEDTITAEQGAGEVSARKAIYILSLGNYSTGTISSGTISKTIQVTTSDLYIRSSVAWLRHNTSSQHTNISATAGIAANLKLQIYKPNGSSCGVSDIQNSSVELVHFNVNSTYGTYTVKISRVDSNTNSVRYAFAWR